MPGGTPYVRTDAQLDRFLGKCRRYFDFFRRELDGIAMTPLEVKDWLTRISEPRAGRAGSTAGSPQTLSRR
jgi:hypothetical protein